MSDYTIHIEYKNKSLSTIEEKNYDLEDYTAFLKQGILKTISDVQDVLYHLEGNKSKQEWNDYTFSMFQKIRHKLLDEANAVSRIPQNLIQKNKDSDALWGIINTLEQQAKE